MEAMEGYLGLFDSYGVAYVALIALAVACIYLIKKLIESYDKRIAKADEREEKLKVEQQEEREKFYKSLDANTKVITDSMELLAELKSIKEEVHTMHDDVKDIKNVIEKVNN